MVLLANKQLQVTDNMLANICLEVASYFLEIANRLFEETVLKYTHFK